MTIFQQLIAKGKAEGEARGEWSGKLKLLEEMMGGAVTPDEVLKGLSVEELEQRFVECQRRYDAEFKRPS